MPTEKDEMEAVKLDEIFKDNLALIRPHVCSIKSIKDAKLCRQWLERLNACSAEEKVMRNVYISELRCQVEAGILNPPFNSPPSDGTLAPFIPAVYNEFDDTPFQEDDSSQSDVTVSTLCQLYHDSEEESKLSAEASLSDVSVIQSEHGEWLQMQQQYEERIAADQAVINRYKQALAFFLTSQTPSEQGMNRIMQLENMYEKKIVVLKLRIKELKNQNTNLQQNLENLQRSREQEKSDNCDWNSLFEEISNLKTKLADVQSSKDTLEENHREVLFHYQREMGNALYHLCQRLSEAKLRNRNVEMKLQVALDQLENLFMQPSKEKLAHPVEDCECVENKNEVHDVNSKLTSLKNLIALKNEEQLVTLTTQATFPALRNLNWKVVLHELLQVLFEERNSITVHCSPPFLQMCCLKDLSEGNKVWKKVCNHFVRLLENNKY